jgi:hypothetical protein
VPFFEHEPWSLEKLSTWAAMTTMDIISPEDVFKYTEILLESYDKGFVLPMRESMMQILAVKGTTRCPQ